MPDEDSRSSHCVVLGSCYDACSLTICVYIHIYIYICPRTYSMQEVALVPHTNAGKLPVKPRCLEKELGRTRCWLAPVNLQNKPAVSAGTRLFPLRLYLHFGASSRFNHSSHGQMRDVHGQRRDYGSGNPADLCLHCHPQQQAQ